ncbi:MAG: hypothetical protein ACON5F_12825 [Jejuia sp.]
MATTFSLLENYNNASGVPNQRTESPAFFIHSALGMQFNRITLIGLNLEYNKYPQSQYNFVPLYLSFQRNIIRSTNDFYLRGGYGSLLDMGRNFRNGRIYKIGAGYQIYYNKGKNSFLAGIDYTNKKLKNDLIESLSSISIYLEFMLF